jgi:predicted DCC family thiol-disulfide oxidoreductase YuxK
MAATSLAIETLFPLALFSRRARRLLVPGAFGMLVGIRVLMGPTFGGFLAVFAFWTPWHTVGERLGAWLRHGQRLVLIYDGGCGLCSRTVRVVRGFDLLHLVEIRDAVGEWDELSSRFPSLDQDRCLEEMHVIASSGRVFCGFEAYRTLARVLPAGWLFVPIAYLPGVAPVGQAVYRFVAAHRSRSCELKPAGQNPEPGHPGATVEVTPRS